MKHTMLTLALAAGSIFCINAQTPDEGVPVALPDSVLVNDTANYTTLPVKSNDLALASYKGVNYKGFGCEVPYGCEVDPANGLKMTYPDGSFATLMTVEDANGCNQKRAYNICSDTGKNLHLTDMHVKKVKINGMKGAIATGMLDGMKVSVAVLPSHGKQLTCIVLNSEARADWTKHVFRTLSD